MRLKACHRIMGTAIELYAPELIAELKEKKEPEKGLPPLDIKGDL